MKQIERKKKHTETITYLGHTDCIRSVRLHPLYRLRHVRLRHDHTSETNALFLAPGKFGADSAAKQAGALLVDVFLQMS